MKLTREQVEHLAYLIRLGLTDQEVEQLQEQLSSILGYFEMLQELDTESIPPTARVISLENVMRPDSVDSSMPVEEVLANAPDREDDYFKVRAVLDTGSADVFEV
ncbi:MAG: Asp-tRNA(Asn)/Glu-tRNA(Gln) amidotransferase subunit GatC [Chloroflexi bacterium]|nr:Asp-tRNA(Asn)/Glu-tRNA(Gln) amidotransferase subunit GatC [Chloroflexota bacterium]